MTDEVLISVENGVGRIRLNRPRALHALTHVMCEAMTAALLAWQDDPAVVAVLIDHHVAPGAEPKLSRGFCAGGDIAMLAASARLGGAEARAFFFTEYRLNHLLYAYAKPVVAFVDGIVMGGGVGISDPARFRVATERTVYAMPESGIGLFPDVGGGWFLPRLPGRTGVWLATTGARITGADCRAIGIATHYMPADRVDTAKQQICAAPARLEAILDDLASAPPPAAWLDQRAAIDRLFAADRYEDILAALERDGGEWARSQLTVLATKSPQAIKVALRQLREGAAMADFADNMRNEYRLGCRVILQPDFVEGVRAVIIDKDNAPRWNPDRAEAVTDDLLDQLFAPLPPGEEWTPLPQLEHRS